MQDVKESSNPFKKILCELKSGSKTYKYYNISAIQDSRYERLPFSIRVLLESAIRNCDNFQITCDDVSKILDWEKNQKDLHGVEVPFKPARVILQDFTGGPTVVDFAAMRETVKEVGGDPSMVNSVCPAVLIIDHSVQVDYTRSADALQKNLDLEFERNKERFMFLKWGSNALKNFSVMPPGSGIMSQIHLEYLAQVVFEQEGLLYPDSVVGTDSHTPLINALGVIGWGVGGIESQAVMLGQTVSLVLPEVIGCKIVGKLGPLSTITDVVLTITHELRHIGVVGKFIEFFGEGVRNLSLADRASLASMCPEYGATVAFFSVDDATLQYLKQSNHSEEKIALIESYLKAVKMFRDYSDASQDPVYSQVLELDISKVVPTMAGPKRPHDKVLLSNMKADFKHCLTNKIGFKGFGLSPKAQDREVPFTFEGREYALRHGSVVIAALASCTYTSNPTVMLGAGLLAKRAVEVGLSVSPYIKTSVSPGSKVVNLYLQHSNLSRFLQKLGFYVVGHGCMTSIGNSGPLPDPVTKAIEKGDLVCCSVLSSNRNFEGRINPSTRANYLASPLLVIAYAIAGTVDIDFEIEPLGYSTEGKPVFLRDIWPLQSTIHELEKQSVLPSMFAQVYDNINQGNENWNALKASEEVLYPWDTSSTYIRRPPFFNGVTKDLPVFKEVTDAHILLNLGDFVTTGHISPAGSISPTSVAARYLTSLGLTPEKFNLYGSRRGNHAVMARGCFAYKLLFNKILGKNSPKTIHFPTGEEMDIFEAAQRYHTEGRPVIILAGKEYGSGSSRDWAAKGPCLLGVRAIIAESFERIHRSNLVGMGIIPLQYLDGQNTESLSLSDKETFTLELPPTPMPRMKIWVKSSDGKSFEVRLRFDTEVELTYFRHGGILNYMIRKLLSQM